MFEQLVGDIKTILESIPAVKSVYSHALAGNPSVYPAVIFYPDNFNNNFETNRSNFKEYRFKMWVVINLNGTNEETVMTRVLPRTVDLIIEKFDQTWNGGTTEDGSRIWQRIETGQFSLANEQKSKEAYAELNLIVKFTNSI